MKGMYCCKESLTPAGVWNTNLTALTLCKHLISLYHELATFVCFFFFDLSQLNLERRLWVLKYSMNL